MEREGDDKECGYQGELNGVIMLIYEQFLGNGKVALENCNSLIKH